MRRKAVALMLAALMTAGLAVTGLTGCGSDADGVEKVRLMVWSPTEHPEWDIDFVYGIMDEASASSQVGQDPDASADVFLYSNDGIAWLTDSKAAAKFGGKYREEIEATNSPEILQSLMLGDDLYGVPYTTNTWYMFYDKSVFSEEDVKNLDTMLEKGVVSFPFTNSWYLPAFYVGNGCTLFTDESAGVDFTGDKAYEVTDYLIDLESNPNFRIDQDGSGIAGLRDGSINAMFTGSWDANAIKEILGDNMGVTSLPSFTLNGEEVQMKAYAGSKAVGVNSHSKYMEQAVALAVYLGSAEVQRLHYELLNVVQYRAAGGSGDLSR